MTKRPSHSITALAVALLLTPIPGCVDDDQGPRAPSEATNAVDARFDSVPLLTIGDEKEDPLSGVIGAALVGDTLIIAQASTMTLRFYDRRTGEFLHSAGGQGEGPGEHERLAYFQTVGDKLYTYDADAFRVTVFDAAGQLMRTMTLELWGGHTSGSVLGFFPDGSILMNSIAWQWWNERAESPVIRRHPQHLSVYDANGVFVDSVGSFLGAETYVEPFGSGGESVQGVAFARSGWAGVLKDGFYVLDNQNPVVSVFDRMGTLIGELGPAPPPDPVSLTSEDRDQFSDFDGIDAGELPQFYPYYAWSAGIGETLWVRHYERKGLRDGGLYRWSVHSRERGLIGRVTASERLGVLDVDGDVAAVVRRDELDVETVELRRIVGWR